MTSLFRPALGGAALLILASISPSSAAFGGLPLNVNPDHIAHNDTLAWSLLGVLGLTMGMVTACGWGIYRQFRRSTPESELLEEIKRQACQTGIPSPLPRPAINDVPWERPADWWKDPPRDGTAGD